MKNTTQLAGKVRLAGVMTAILAVSAAIAPKQAAAIEHDLTAAGTQTLNLVGQFGGTAIVSDYFEQPTGTGVFEPFLTIDANGQTSTGTKTIEQGYNTDGFTALYMDQLRPQWNEYLKVSDLATITIGSVDYFAFILDANEPGGNKDLISIDNIRIYTSTADNTANVGNDETKLNDLGTLRWAMNDPLSGNLNGFNAEQWVKLDASQENVEQGSSNSNGGSGKGDFIIYIPQSAFGSSLGTDDYVWFYNLNGVHYTADKDLASQSGYEEWRAVVNPTPSRDVPDAGGTFSLLGSALLGMAFLGRRFQKA